MKLMKKTALVMFTMCIMVICTVLCTANVSAASAVDSGECGNNVTWTLYDNGEMVIEGSGWMDNYRLSSYAPWDSHHNRIKKITVSNGVLSIGENAFTGCGSLTDVSIGDDLVEIGEAAFYGCTNLTNVSIGKSVDLIGEFSFSCCSALSKIVIPGNVLEIGGSAFAECTRLSDVTICNGVKTIGVMAFKECKRLTAITLPASVKKISSSAFDQCTKLSTVVVLSEKAEYSIIGSVFRDTADDLILYGYAGSTTQTYAARNGHDFAIYKEPAPGYLTGDITNDGAVDITDAIALFQYSMMPTLYPISYPGTPDFTKDSNIDIADAIILFQHSMMPDLYPLS